MMKITVTALCLLAAFACAEALTCYNCMGNVGERPKSDVEEQLDAALESVSVEAPDTSCSDKNTCTADVPFCMKRDTVYKGGEWSNFQSACTATIWGVGAASGNTTGADTTGKYYVTDSAGKSVEIAPTEGNGQCVEVYKYTPTSGTADALAGMAAALGVTDDPFVTSMCFCVEELCNGAGATTATVLTMTLTVAVALVFKH